MTTKPEPKHTHRHAQAHTGICVQTRLPLLAWAPMGSHRHQQSLGVWRRWRLQQQHKPPHTEG